MLNNGKAKIEKVFNGITISIPSRKNWFFLVFGAVWFGGWFFGFFFASGTFLSGNDNSHGFLKLWLAGWTVGGLVMIFLLLWGFFGQEKFIHDNGEISFEKTIFGVGLKKKLQANEVKNFRFEFVNTENVSRNMNRASVGLGAGKIKFDYGMKTYSFGLGVDDAEANYLVTLLKEHFKN